jgi:hypothetical protein
MVTSTCGLKIFVAAVRLQAQISKSDLCLTDSRQRQLTVDGPEDCQNGNHNEQEGSEEGCHGRLPD